MKKWISAGLMLLLLALTGCTATIYGVPQGRWETMGEQERVAAMEAYRARQTLLRQQREERARQLALERERQGAIEAEAARQRQLRVAAVHRGEGVYGDLLRVRLEEGRLKLNGSHRAYQPIAFRIAAGESKRVEVVDHKGRRATLLASYDGSTLLLDESPGNARSGAIRLAYEDDWEGGKTYPGLTAKGPLELRGVSVTVQVLGEPPRDRRASRRPQVIVIREAEQRPQRPETVVVREAPRHDRPAVGEPPAHHETPEAVAKVPPRPAKPAETGKEPPRREKPETVGGKQTPPKQPAETPPARVKVTFHKGEIRTKGRPAPIAPQSIELQAGEARTLVLRGPVGKVEVRVSYEGGEVAIDDRPGKGKATTRLGFGPRWRDGSPYRIEATANRLVEGLDVSVLAL